MSKWWFSSLFFRKKKTVPPESDLLDFQAIEKTNPLSCPTRDRVRGPQGRKRPTKAISVTLRQSAYGDDSSDPGSHSCRESFVRRDGKSDGNFNQTTNCSESATGSPARVRDAIISSDLRTPSTFSDHIEVL